MPHSGELQTEQYPRHLPGTVPVASETDPAERDRKSEGNHPRVVNVLLRSAFMANPGSGWKEIALDLYSS